MKLGKEKSRKELTDRLVKVNELYKPTPLIRAMTVKAMDDFSTFQDLDGLPPNGGGYDEQDAEWVDAIRCITNAKNRAESDHQTQQMNEQKAQANSGMGSSSRPRRR